MTGEPQDRVALQVSRMQGTVQKRREEGFAELQRLHAEALEAAVEARMRHGAGIPVDAYLMDETISPGQELVVREEAQVPVPRPSAELELAGEPQRDEWLESALRSPDVESRIEAWLEVEEKRHEGEIPIPVTWRTNPRKFDTEVVASAYDDLVHTLPAHCFPEEP